MAERRFTLLSGGKAGRVYTESEIKSELPSFLRPKAIGGAGGYGRVKWLEHTGSSKLPEGSAPSAPPPLFPMPAPMTPTTIINQLGDMPERKGIEEAARLVGSVGLNMANKGLKSTILTGGRGAKGKAPIKQRKLFGSSAQDGTLLGLGNLPTPGGLTWPRQTTRK